MLLIGIRFLLGALLILFSMGLAFYSCIMFYETYIGTFLPHYTDILIGVFISLLMFFVGFLLMWGKRHLKQILYISGLFLIAITVFLIISTQSKHARKIHQEVVERRLAASYLKNIEIVSSKIHLEKDGNSRLAYLLITIKNMGEKDILGLWLRLGYYSRTDFTTPGSILLITTLYIPIENSLSPGRENYLKFLLSRHDYPYSKSEQIKHLEVELVDCKLRF